MVFDRVARCSKGVCTVAGVGATGPIGGGLLQGVDFADLLCFDMVYYLLLRTDKTKVVKVHW